MLKIGLTGGIGSGKTAVSRCFENLGIPVIDTDVIARELVQHNPAVLKEIVTAFGEDIVNSNGQLDRKKLAQLVFRQAENKQRLENILHPKIRLELERRLNAISNTGYVIIVIPLLFETDFHRLIDRSLVVLADEHIRVERVRQRDNRTLDEIRSIMASQVSDKQRRDKADDVIENNNDINDLEKHVLELHKKYRRLAESAD